MNKLPEKVKIAVIGLGYVGLPLAVEFAVKFPVLGYDIDMERIAELQAGRDSTSSVQQDILSRVNEIADKSLNLKFSAEEIDLRECNAYIITVPTPTDSNHHPDIQPLQEASRTIGRYVQKGDLVIYESTVYPGMTEEVCGAILEEESGLCSGEDFDLGYSPERINPGAGSKKLTEILKITAGSTARAAQRVNSLYESIIGAGTYLAPSIRVAEAAKLAENSQRDVNIAFVNELAMILRRLDIDTREVLEAAGTKWNFLPFEPGLVGGHCIAVDPYYLARKSEDVGYYPEIILNSRKLNEGMGYYVASEFIKLLLKKNIDPNSARILILGLSFKENCPDTRNSKVLDILNELREYGIKLDVYDPWIEKSTQNMGESFTLLDSITHTEYQGLILAVKHAVFREINPRDYCAEKSVVYDVKGVWEKNEVDGRL